MLPLFALMFMPYTMRAQDARLTFPYFNSFEDPDEILEWQTLVGDDAARCTDRWYIDNATDVGVIDGTNALYISSDGGNHPIYANDKNVVVVYRRIALPSTITKNKRVELTFDWKNQAPAKSGTSIQVALVPDNFPIDVESVEGSLAEPVWLGSNKCNITVTNSTRPVEKLQDASYWQTAHTKLDMTPGEVYKLVFVWINDGKSNSTEKNTTPYISACIDNIQMSSADCPMPTAIVVNDGCDSTVLTWKGSIYNYELQYRRAGTTTWRTITDIKQNRHTFLNMPEGIYDFRLRSIGSVDEVSVFNTLYSQLVFCPDNHCINYVDLYSDDISCFRGQATWGNASLSECKPIDYGNKERMSQHTVHWDPNEYDPRTLGRLKTVPDGEFASIRLGNWNNGAEAEAIKIKYEVDVNKAAVLLLSYALVFEEPNHEKEEQPYFKLVLLTEDGYELDPTCGKAEFYADPSDPAWNRNAHNNASIAWKDWTTIGFDLSLYDGETLTIHLESRDCSQGAHYAYSYFVMGCASGRIENVSCGADPIVDLEAPPGFDYRWYTSANPDDSISGSQVLQVEASDRTSYGCEVMFKQNHECNFHITTTVSPREPHAEMQYERVPAQCKNIVRFINKSHVDSRDAVGNPICKSDEKTESVYWYFDGGDVEYGDTIYKEFPREGGRMNVKLKVGLSDDHCTDSLVQTISIPTILSRPDTIDTVLCWSQSIQLSEGWPLLGVDTVHTAHFKNCAECDSLVTLILDIRDRIYPTDIADTICFGDSLVHDGKAYKIAGNYNLKYYTAEGCDSLVTVKLSVRDEVTFSYDTKPEAGAPNTGEIIISDAPPGYTYTVDGVSAAPLTGLKGGTYTVIVFNQYGCASLPVEITVERVCLEFTFENDGMDGSLYTCADDSLIDIAVTATQSTLTTYQINYGQKAIDAGFINYSDTFDSQYVTILLPDSCHPDYYDAEVVINDIICDDVIMPVRFAVHYPSDIVAQKWDDVLAVRNDTYNGGYSFSAFQWYRDGQPLSGETSSYLYIPHTPLDTASSYHVLLTRSDDGIQLPTCPILPQTPRTEASPYPYMTSVDANAGLRIESPTPRQVAVRLYTSAGSLCFSGTVTTDSETIPIPSTPGVYILFIDDTRGTSHHKIIVR